MLSNSLRNKICQSLPIKNSGFTIRLCTRSDMDLLASWPQYSWPYEAFNFSFAFLTQSGIDAYFKERIEGENRITLICDFESSLAIGYVALLQIDWETRQTENMAIRIHPEWCSKGIGTKILEAICDWWFVNEMRTLQLDVAATNQRAIRCYRKVGFVRTGEFWREAPDLQGLDWTDSRHNIIKDHVRFKKELPEIRFYWMKKRKDEAFIF